MTEILGKESVKVFGTCTVIENFGCRLSCFIPALVPESFDFIGVLNFPFRSSFFSVSPSSSNSHLLNLGRILLKGGIPAAPSGTATLLRLSPSHQFYLR